MAGSVNKVILIGNLGKDPEVRRTQDGRPIVNFSLATTDSWRDKATNERKDRTEWHRIVIFNEALARVAEQYLKKGAKVYLEGQLQTRKWTDQSGAEKYTTEVVLQNYSGALTMLDSRGSGGAGGPPSGDDRGDDRGDYRGDYGAASPAPAARPASAAAPVRDDMDDSIPF